MISMAVLALVNKALHLGRKEEADVIAGVAWKGPICYL